MFKETGYTITGIGVFRNVNNVQMLIDTSDDNKPIGLEDVCNSGYIRYLNDTKISNVNSYSCTRSIGMATDLILVLLHNKININNTSLRLASLLLKCDDIDILNVDINKENIEKSEGIKNNPYELIKITFRYKEEYNEGDCIIDNDCETINTNEC
ncbi:MAG: hypothetical protein KC414_00975 [Romboutsia sp.]|nr:hypothetical protein [Romboutsia sp.]